MLMCAATAKLHLRSGLQRALALESRSLVSRVSTLLALIHDRNGEVAEREEMIRIWRTTQDGDRNRLTAETEEVKRIADIIRLVGVRAATGWP